VTNTNRYPAQVFWSDDDDGFVAIAPDLPGCSAFGDTQGEALAQLQDAIAAWIEATRSAGNPIPPPSDPAREADYSGKVLVRMPRELHGQLARLAKAENVSLNHYVVYLLTSASTRHSIEASSLARGSAATASLDAAHLAARMVSGGFVKFVDPLRHAPLWGTYVPYSDDLVVRSTGTGLRELEPIGLGAVSRREARHG
jgi:predicted RNase H-like HicB family nuclease